MSKWLNNAGLGMFYLMGLIALDTHANEIPAFEAVLSKPINTQRAEAGIISVSITNHSAEAILLPKPFTPLLQPDHHLMNNIFLIKDQDGKPVRFIGRAIRMSPDARMEYFTRIDSSQTLTTEVNLGTDYDLRSNGIYSISYEQWYGGLEHQTKDAPLKKIKSNTLQIYINMSLISGARMSKAMTGQNDASASCDAQTRLPIIQSAENIALKFAANGQNAFVKMYSFNTVTQAGKMAFRAKLLPNADYNRWFGTPEDDSPSFPKAPLVSQVWTQTDFIPAHIAQGIYDRNLYTKTYICGCSSDYPSTTAA